MRLTNNHNLPEPIFRAIANDPYTKGDADYSVTELLQPVQAWKLTSGHGDEITEDAMDRVWALFGKTVHKILETGIETTKEHYTEMRFSSSYAGKTVSGQFDYACPEPEANGGLILWDYKVTSIWSIILEKEGLRPDWITQLNWLKNLCERQGWQISGLRILAILRDWSAGELRRRTERGKIDGYPKAPVLELTVPMASSEDVSAEIENRVRIFEAARVSDPPECTDEERWAQPKVIAVHKHGVKKAVKLFKGETQVEDAKEFLGGKTPDHYLEVRPGRNSRCEDYCLAAPFCPQFKALKESAP